MSDLVNKIEAINDADRGSSVKQYQGRITQNARYIWDLFLVGDFKKAMDLCDDIAQDAKQMKEQIKFLQ
jgi:pterin-4a-carbinolamine dehydratase